MCVAYLHEPRVLYALAASSQAPVDAAHSKAPLLGNVRELDFYGWGNRIESGDRNGGKLKEVLPIGNLNEFAGFPCTLDNESGISYEGFRLFHVSGGKIDRDG